MARSRDGRTQICSADQARTRLKHARKFLELAELTGEGGEAAYNSAGAALAVLSGIAAADAACCAALGRRSRGQDHLQAVGLVEQIAPDGPQAANGLRRLLSIKDEAHYGLVDVSGQHLRSALNQAEALVDFAARTVERRPR